jgi:ubiquinone/menaquinone biosynthesis C-methylase UbiE
MSELDSHEYKEAERQCWDIVADGWQKWWKTIEKGSDKVSKRLIELAEIKAGSKVLDIATGLGEPAITAANHVGSNGHILATDISSKMLSAAEQRAISMGLQNVIEFKEGDIEKIDLPNSTFDAALCRWGLMFLPDLKTGLCNIHKTLIDGGRLAAAVWASPNRDTLIAMMMNTIMKETNTEPPPPGTPGPFSLSDENNLKNSFMTSGFKNPVVERMNVTFDFDSPDEFTAFTSETAGPLQKMLGSQPNERRIEILKAVSKAAEKYSDNTGKVRFENVAMLIVGKK